MDNERQLVFDELLIAADKAEESGNLFTSTLMRGFANVYLRATRYGNINDPGFMTETEYITRIVRHSSWIQAMEDVAGTTEDLSELRLMSIALKKQNFMRAALVLKEIVKPIGRVQNSCLSVLIDDGVVSLWQVFDAARLRFSLHPREHDISILRAMERFEYVNEEDVANAQAKFHNLELVDPLEQVVPHDVLDFVGEFVCRSHNVFPLEYSDKCLTIATTNPLDIRATEDIRFRLTCSVLLKIATKTQIQAAINRQYASIHTL